MHFPFGWYFCSKCVNLILTKTENRHLLEERIFQIVSRFHGCQDNEVVGDHDTEILKLVNIQ